MSTLKIVLLVLWYLSIGVAVDLIDVKLDGYDDEAPYLAEAIFWPVFVIILAACRICDGFRWVLRRWGKKWGA